MPHPHLAPEIWDQILDHLWNDSAALKRCSRTCRSWVPASRYHLFYAMNLDEPSDTQRLQQFLDSHPDNFRYVRLLRLRLGSVMGDGVASLIPRLKNVTTLECEFKTHLLNVTEATKQALSSLLSLKSVLLWGFYFGDYVAIIEILSALPESLTSVEASVFTPLPTVALDPSLPPSTKIDHVQELAIRSAPHGVVGGIVPWLMNATRIRPRRLVLECPQPRDQIALAKLLNDPCVAECIEDLTIDVRQRPERMFRTCEIAGFSRCLPIARPARSDTRNVCQSCFTGRIKYSFFRFALDLRAS
ncbi:hypothetical protein WOLCODRAFT_27787 [Wolfiporia cocos MD-104 SS10]|uniref:F-box domain-containing protein n=1 Tax=Wolfiporia cocos (strain MD-104) TaxID=742152 RepID=A0A2H3JCC2_WOLCO|nr:hypothetical protein WOLCODRAFT_27787 [Wolfiporia cocos MD-104 SS10]